MYTLGYHQHLAVLAHERGDYLSASQHYQEAANSYSTPEKAEPWIILAEQELAHEGASECILVMS
jgi:hypothetical protein